jgi:hypothetical protein
MKQLLNCLQCWPAKGRKSTIRKVTWYESTIRKVTWYESTIRKVTWYESTIRKVTWYERSAKWVQNFNVQKAIVRWCSAHERTSTLFLSYLCAQNHRSRSLHQQNTWTEGVTLVLGVSICVRGCASHRRSRRSRKPKVHGSLQSPSLQCVTESKSKVRCVRSEISARPGHIIFFLPTTTKKSTRPAKTNARKKTKKKEKEAKKKVQKKREK